MHSQHGSMSQKEAKSRGFAMCNILFCTRAIESGLEPMVTIPDESDVVIKHIITPQLSWIQVTFMIFTKIGLVSDVSVVTILAYGLLENLLFKHL
ncbi:hypothetical protein BofuT4_uP024160.1 [Botrytis cinerea T4]|uniref:Uncharacterized protein n=1 Tax=Botryotinia fuckeliana (strain T4) TaxID=999810 RepID=G2YFQ9_BOTF4|nr:hypothetical protein BofuT4_uP024160.1 [Botrytis cinerea T4]